MFQNKKIIDIEKNQKPMVECNKRLAERNKTLMDSCKNLEETLSFVRDEKLTLVRKTLSFQYLLVNFRRTNMIDLSKKIQVYENNVLFQKNWKNWKDIVIKCLNIPSVLPL
jgi:hypothetical protein